jgi:hypothetical protein
VIARGWGEVILVVDEGGRRKGKGRVGTGGGGVDADDAESFESAVVFWVDV